MTGGKEIEAPERGRDEKKARNKDLSWRMCCNCQNSGVSRGPSAASTGRRDETTEADRSGRRGTARHARLVPRGGEKSLWLLPAESHRPISPRHGAARRSSWLSPSPSVKPEMMKHHRRAGLLISPGLCELAT